MPRSTTAGDLVCILNGCEVPFILRKTEKDFQNIGECHIHGVMHGETASALKDEENFNIG